MKERSIIAIIFLVGILSCTSQSGDDKKTNTAEEIVDPFSKEVPFKIDRESIYSILPDSLKNGFKSGLAVLNICIDDSGNYIGFELIKFKIESETANGGINYLGTKTNSPVPKEEYDSEIMPYFDFFDNYVSNLGIEKKENVELSDVNNFTLMVRLK